MSNSVFANFYFDVFHRSMHFSGFQFTRKGSHGPSCMHINSRFGPFAALSIQFSYQVDI